MPRARNLNRPATCCEDVNRELRAAGHSEILVKGEAYYYFAEGDAPDWRESSVMVYRISDMTIRQWLDAHADFVTKHKEV